MIDRLAGNQTGKRWPQLLQARRGPVLLMLTTLFWASLYTYPAIIAPYLSELGVSLTATGLVISSYGLTQTLLRLPAGVLSDRLRNKRVFIIAGLFLSLLSGCGLFLTRQVGLILLFRALAGVAAAMWVHFSTLYLTYHPAGSAGKAMGQINFSSSFGQMAAMLAGSFLAQLYGWRFAFLLAAVVAVPGLLLSFAVHEDRPDPAMPAEPPPSLKEVAALGQNRVLFWSSILALLAQLATFAVSQGFVPQYASQLGAGKALIGLLAALSLLPRAIAGLLGGSLLARWFKLRTLVVFGFILVSGTTCLLPFVHTLPLLFLNQFICGIGAGFQLSLLMAMCTRTVAPGRKASAMGFFQAVYGIGMVIGPILLGSLADQFSLGTGFVAVGMLSLLAGLLAWLVL